MKIKIDRKKVEIAVILISLGVAVRVALMDYANIEPILPIALLAGYIIGGWYALWVPLAMMVLSDWVVYSLGTGDMLSWNFIVGVTFFTWTGMTVAGFVGKSLKPRMILRMGNMAIFTGIGVATVLIYDAWTMIGWWLVSGQSFELVLGGQASFTVYHILSTLIFVPLFGTGYVYIKEYGVPEVKELKSCQDAPDDE